MSSSLVWGGMGQTPSKLPPWLIPWDSLTLCLGKCRVPIAGATVLPCTSCFQGPLPEPQSEFLTIIPCTLSAKLSRYTIASCRIGTVGPAAPSVG